MGRTKETQEYSPRISEIRRCLFSEYRWIGLLAGKGKPYDHIIEEMVRIGEYWCSDESDKDDGAFTMKWIAERTGEKTSNITKLLRQMYDDLFDLNQANPELFVSEGDVLCEFSFTGYGEGRCCYFSFGMKHVPRIGERVEFMFIEALMQTGYFFVKDVMYLRERGKTTVNIQCEAGSFNKYRELIRDKAHFMKEIDFRDEFESRLYLDDMLRAYSNRGHVPSVESIKQERDARFKRWNK